MFLALFGVCLGVGFSFVFFFVFSCWFLGGCCGVVLFV